jgi:ATP/maltotriose-dependent transcriptional regulator MalT
MKSPDPASLQNLNDIVLPAPVGWWPLANGWYFLIGILLIAIAWLGFKSIQRWIKNGYRRAALQELNSLTEGINNADKRNSSLRQLPVLLKRTALSAYTRHQVASLSGADWVSFLNSQLNKPAFTDTTADLLNNISYSTGDLGDIDDKATTDLLDAIKEWLKYHPAIDSKTGGTS